MNSARRCATSAQRDQEHKMKSWIAFLFCSSLLVLGASQAQAAVPLATPEQDRYAKQAVPPSGNALIYVYRLDDTRPQTSPGVWLNKRDSGRLEPRTYGMWAAGPGRLEIRAGRADATPFTITCEAGRIYFVQLAVNADGSIRLRQVPYGTGRTEMGQTLRPRPSRHPCRHRPPYRQRQRRQRRRHRRPRRSRSREALQLKKTQAKVEAA
jgi:hypothetical protein